MKNFALLSSNLPSVINRSNLSPSREAFHFYFYSNNDPTSPKGPRKQKTEPILGTVLLEKKKTSNNRLNGESMAWLTANWDVSGNNAEFVSFD